MEWNQEIEGAVPREIPGWLRRQKQPGIYQVLVGVDTGEVSTRDTFSGDNSYIPGDRRLAVLTADTRERLTNDDVGLDDDGDIIERDTLTCALYQAERTFEAAQ